MQLPPTGFIALISQLWAGAGGAQPRAPPCKSCRPREHEFPRFCATIDISIQYLGFQRAGSIGTSTYFNLQIRDGWPLAKFPEELRPSRSRHNPGADVRVGGAQLRAPCPPPSCLQPPTRRAARDPKLDISTSRKRHLQAKFPAPAGETFPPLRALNLLTHHHAHHSIRYLFPHARSAHIRPLYPAINLARPPLLSFDF
ncbi:hypothetical protein B0H11DRAFT_2235326 [Mycena galericulata]|nr:hypothetical protein B0H11DRAFT_2235326 [Mycena galericulata]